MGLFNFIKEAGKKLGIGGDDAPDVEAVKKELASHDLGTDKVQVEVVDDKVVLKGGHRGRQHARHFQGRGRRVESGRSAGERTGLLYGQKG